jgi:hypothetical protein
MDKGWNKGAPFPIGPQPPTQTTASKRLNNS